MAVLNPPGALPGLARSMTNHLLTSRASYDVDRLTQLFAPEGLSDSPDWTRGVGNTLQAAKAIGLLNLERGGTVTVSESASEQTEGRPFSRSSFHRLLRDLVLDMQRDGDPWSTEQEARTAGARDLARALSWFLAQDALRPALSWGGQDDHSVQALQSEQLRHIPDDERPFVNDTRWGAFSRWAVALGFVEPAPVTTGGIGLVPLPLGAIWDVVARMEHRVWPVGAFLQALADSLPVLDGGLVRAGLRRIMAEEADPGVRAYAVDTSISQVVLMLEDEGMVTLSYGSDAEACTFSDTESDRKVTNVEVHGAAA